MPSGVWFHFSCVFRPFRGAPLMAVCVCVVFNQLLYWGIRVRLKQLDNVFLALHVCWRARNPLSTACFGCAFKMHSSEAVYSVIYDRFQCTVNRVIMCMIIDRKMVTHNYCFPHFWTTVKSYIILLKEHHDIFPCMLAIWQVFIHLIHFICLIHLKKKHSVHLQKRWQTSQPWLVSQRLAAVQHFSFLHEVDLFAALTVCSTSLHTIPQFPVQVWHSPSKL